MAQYKWFEIGIQLGIPRHKLKWFRKEDDPLSAVIDYWLCGNVESVPLTWRSVVEVLKSDHVDESDLKELKGSIVKRKKSLVVMVRLKCSN